MIGIDMYRFRKHDLRDKVALITGASSGIGAATARRLARGGLRVVLVARRAERLAMLLNEIKASGRECMILPLDLAKESSRFELFDCIQSTYGSVDVLVNNAGFGWYGHYANMPLDVAREMIQVNISSLVHLTSLFLPAMIKRRSGHIINVGSIAGSLPSQGVALYSATKSFIDGFTTALFRELVGSGVYVSVVKPGPVMTEFCSNAANLTAGLRMPTEQVGILPEKVADAIWSLLRWPRRVLYVPHILGITPWIEACFGWLMDRIGPMLLNRKQLTS